jgi:Tol biopolymer transport system component
MRPVGTWSRDGLILFNSEDRHGLYVVPATGGEPRSATSLDASRQENLHAWPHFLPDGHHFIYLVHSAKPENTGIYVSSLDSKESKRLISTSTNPSYAELRPGAGYLLFMQNATLMAQPLNTSRWELGSERFPISEQVRLPPANVAGFAAFSVSRNGVLAYQTLQATTELVWFDRQGHRAGTVGQASDYSNPALSPDGRRLAVARLDAQLGTRDIWLFDLVEGTPPFRFTFDPSDESNPMWSPGGDRIAFDFYSKGNIDIYQKATTGIGQAEPLTESSAVKVLESWVPDERSIFYDSGGKLWMLPLTGERKPTVVLSENGEAKPAISTNMKWLAYQSSESGRFELYVQNFPPSGAKWQITTAGGEEPYWSRDGKELFYLEGNRLMVMDVKTGGPTFQFGVPKPLFELRLEVEGRRSRYQVAANGQRFLVNVPLKSTLSAPITVVTNWTARLKK